MTTKKDPKKTREKKFATAYRGKNLRACRFCGRSKGLIQKYGLYTCRRCFRTQAPELGFEKKG